MKNDQSRLQGDQAKDLNLDGDRNSAATRQVVNQEHLGIESGQSDIAVGQLADFTLPQTGVKTSHQQNPQTIIQQSPEAGADGYVDLLRMFESRDDGSGDLLDNDDNTDENERDGNGDRD